MFVVIVYRCVDVLVVIVYCCVDARCIHAPPTATGVGISIQEGNKTETSSLKVHPKLTLTVHQN